MRTIASFLLAASAVVCTLPALAQFAKPEDAVRYRKSAMFIMQQNLGRVAAMSAGRVPFDAKVAADSAVVAEFMSRLPWPAFGAGTDKGETRAKPEIWAEPAKFSEYEQKMQTELRGEPAKLFFNPALGGWIARTGWTKPAKHGRSSLTE